ncbi:HAMP domain-containing histidine kinase [Clostridium sp. WLY-B-L2]|uniref:histidine kinase n=1 Tax=Clostridium aromativorans TaxID=2836848 RepID=A0ABS8N869_9CLOT|nr:HAMP domain-containing sensor histidine kinase [Clostridium aromativorans]MCC9296005.1 HAMP domain-containing histidine kinase [Clostridium aromativorans]
MLRNREFRQIAILFSLIAAVAVTLGFAVNRLAGILAIASATAFGTAFFAFTKARYKRIAQISDQIDLVLHNADRLYIGELDEGELSILQSEITKMTLRIREQNDALKKEKEHLADSMADIAHQLRTPLTSVNLILSLLENNPDENERKALIRETKELFVQMDWLLTSLLKLSRLDAGIVVFQSDQIDVNTLISAALHQFLIPMELHNIAFQTDVPKGIIIQGDFGWLSEAIQNILKNCMESAGDNGKIEIVCRSNPLFTEIAIHDSGAGFEKEDLPCLFDRFYRGKNAGTTGYGIGLALCKTIITWQDGTITAKNHPQGGAIFSIRFPK